MHALFPSLAPELQVRALQTMAMLWQGNPPRHDISLEAVSEALLAEQRLLDGVREGRWAEADLRDLEARITAVGGCLAPGLRSSGPGSLQAWRQELQEPLELLLQQPVLAAAEAALGPRLQHHQPPRPAQLFQPAAAGAGPPAAGQPRPLAGRAAGARPPAPDRRVPGLARGPAAAIAHARDRGLQR